MRYSSSILAALAAAPLLVSARPVRRAASANTALVFQFANVLEQLETEFYKQALDKFQESDFTNAGFSTALIPTQLLKTIQEDESTHTTVIQQALKDNGADPVICNFKFDSALTDVPTLAATARAVEYVGVAAYLGGATIIDDPVFLDAAASILTVEARHQTVLNIMSGTGSAIPQAFDIPLTPQEILSIAGGFIDGDCDLGLDATNPLTVTNTDAIQQGTKLEFSGNNVQSDGQFCNMMVGGAPFSVNLPIDQCVVPDGVNGPVVLWITEDNNPLVNNVIDRDTSKQVAGPAIIFVDSSPETIGQMVRGSGSNSAGASQTGSSSSGGEENSGANGAAAPASTPLPPNFTGESPDKKTTVNGIKMVDRPESDPIANVSSSGSSSDSATSTDTASASSTSA